MTKWQIQATVDSVTDSSADQSDTTDDREYIDLLTS